MSNCGDGPERGRGMMSDDLTDRAPTGFVLAAGYGTRLAPLTDHVPKPLLPVGGRTLLDLAVDALRRAGCSHIGVNTHHLAEMIDDQVRRRPDAANITLFHEPEILGTGGALDGARELLAQSPCFVLYNGDVRCDIDMKDLLNEHHRTGALATLVLVDWPRINTVIVDPKGIITDIAGLAGTPADAGESALTYAGIGVFDRRLLADIEPGFSSLIDPLVRAIVSEPGCVRAFAPPDVRWDDLGTLPRYLLAVAQDGAEGDSPLQVQPITGHGSDRRFWRLATVDWSSVAMVSPPADQEYERYVAIGCLLRDHDLGAPRILSEHAADKTVLLEDLGRRSLLAAVKQASAGGVGDASVREASVDSELRALYEPVVDHLLALQSATAAAHRDCPLAVDRILDHTMLLWETGYFREHFLVGHGGIDPDAAAGLDAEFEQLATVVAAQPLRLLHRDFQSQNILLQDQQVRLVDFQGLRLGPVTYDVMSLLFDPYVVLPRDVQRHLLVRFSQAVSKELTAAGQQIGPGAVQAMAVAAGLQRVMQALGAFGFLGHHKGKLAFLEHIPRGLANLGWLLEELVRLQEAAVPEQALWLPDRSTGCAPGGKLLELVREMNP